MEVLRRDPTALAGNISNNPSFNRMLTIPTIVTLIGILAILFYIIQFGLGLMTGMIPAILTLAILSDAFDGTLARRLNQETHFGKLTDHIRDRSILIAGAGNILVIEQNVASLMVLLSVAGMEIISFLRGDVVDFKNGIPRPESFFVKLLYIVAFCSIVAMTAKIYWNMEPLPSVWFTSVILIATGIAGLIETCKR